MQPSNPYMLRFLRRRRRMTANRTFWSRAWISEECRLVIVHGSLFRKPMSELVAFPGDVPKPNLPFLLAQFNREKKKKGSENMMGGGTQTNRNPMFLIQRNQVVESEKQVGIRRRSPLCGAPTVFLSRPKSKSIKTKKRSPFPEISCVVQSKLALVFHIYIPSTWAANQSCP